MDQSLQLLIQHVVFQNLLTSIENLLNRKSYFFVRINGFFLKSQIKKMIKYINQKNSNIVCF